MNNRPITLPRSLVAAVARSTDTTEALTRVILTAALAEIRRRAANGTVRVRNFGTFHTLVRRGGRRPSLRDTDEIIEVPDRQRLALKAASEPVEE